MHDPVEAGTEQDDDVGVLKSQPTRRHDGERMLIVDDALAHGRGQERKTRRFDKLPDFFFGPGVGGAFAENDERTLGIAKHVDGPLDIGARRLGAWRLGATLGDRDVCLLDLGREKVIREVEVGCARASVDRGADGLLAVKGNALGRIGARRILGVDASQFHLGGFLKRPHALLVGVTRTPEKNHGPAIFLRVRKAGEPVDHAWPRHRETREVTHGARRVAGGLFVPHADELDALFLRGGGDSEDRESDDAEHVFHALLLEAASDEGITVEGGHGGDSPGIWGIAQV
jgi:hypothetical protein